MDDDLDQFTLLDELATIDFADEFPDLPEFEEPWDEMLEQQEIEDFEQVDEDLACFSEEACW